MQFLVVLVVATLFLKYFWVLVAVVAGAYVVHLLAREIRRSRADGAAEAQRLEEIRARADQQHTWVFTGDPRGIYGGEIAGAAP
jgi:nitrate/nitrite transporter NarK